MQSVPQTTPAPKAYWCHYHDRHGALTKTDGEYLFRDSETNELTVIEPRDFAWCMMHGTIGLAEAQRIVDEVREAVRRKHERCTTCGLIGCRGGADCDPHQLPLLQAVA